MSNTEALREGTARYTLTTSIAAFVEGAEWALAQRPAEHLPAPALWLAWNTSYTGIRFWTADAEVAAKQAATGLTLPPFYSAEQMRAALAQPAASVPPELDVRRIMLDVVPGDGSGLEIYAKSVADVERVLTDMGQRIEDFEAQQPAASGEPDASAILGAVARGWTHPKTAGRVMDPDLAIAIAAEVFALYSAAPQPAPARVPLTQDQKDALWSVDYREDSRRAAFQWHAAGIDAAERHHGITAPQEPKP